MALGFTKSKVDSNLFFNVEDGRPLMLLLYVDDLFLTENRNSLKLQEGDLLPILNEGLGYDALLSRHGGVAKCGWNLPRKREVCIGDLEEVQDDGLQGYDHTYGIKPEAIKCCFIRVS